MSDGETLVSSGQSFELGFFSPGNSKNRYLGIWYKQNPETVSWVANRNNPIAIIKNGLILSNHTNSVIWSSNTIKMAESPIAQLLDSGNAMVSSDSSESCLWQSFDYPSNTWLPGMKITNDFNKGLTSWKSLDDPSLGDYTRRIFLNNSGLLHYYVLSNATTEWAIIYTEPNDLCDSMGSVEQIVSSEFRKIQFLYNGTTAATDNLFHAQVIKASERLTSAGNTFELGFFSPGTSTNLYVGIWMKNVPSNDIVWVANRDLPFSGFSTGLTINDDGYPVILDGMTSYRVSDDPSSQNVSATLWNSGNLVLRNENFDILWQSFDYPTNTFLPGMKLGYSRMTGKVWSLTSCRCSKHSSDQSCQCLRGFYSSEKRIRQGQYGGSPKVDKISSSLYEKSNPSYPLPSGPQVSNSDAKACKVDCLNNCSCNTYAYNRSGHCFRWDGDILDLEQLPAKDPNGRTILSNLPLLNLTVGETSLFSKTGELDTSQDILLFDMEMSITTSSSEFSGSYKLGKGKKKDAALPLFSFANVSAATENFSLENKLGEGGFGPVYKGKLLNGQEIAVKGLSKRSGQGLEELKNETMLIAKLQHRNLVRLLGCCLEQGEKILVYEFMPNKSLDAFLFDKTRNKLLDWHRRMHVIDGIARGLLYLHHDSRLRIIHRDLKASNILLDNSMNPKISDFGLARKFGRDQTEDKTRRVVGTYGYMSPEYAFGGRFSLKSDVFSFGVLVLEIVTGKRNRGFSGPDQDQNLLGHAWRLWIEERPLELIDNALGDLYNVTEVLRCINVALLCVQQRPEDRPNMPLVLLMLCGESTLPYPKQPGFFLERNLTPAESALGKEEPSSVDESTITALEPR
ncbi:hypothetical protein CRYUN_Cryun11dG0028300 [Craigia yunnanensis]